VPLVRIEIMKDRAIRQLDRQHRAVVPVLDGLRQRIPDRQSSGEPLAFDTAGRTASMVPVLLRDGARRPRLHRESKRLQQADLAKRLAEAFIRRRHLRAYRQSVR